MRNVFLLSDLVCEGRFMVCEDRSMVWEARTWFGMIFEDPSPVCSGRSRVLYSPSGPFHDLLSLFCGVDCKGPVLWFCMLCEDCSSLRGPQLGDVASVMRVFSDSSAELSELWWALFCLLADCWSDPSGQEAGTAGSRRSSSGIHRRPLYAKLHILSTDSITTSPYGEIPTHKFVW